MVSSDVIEWIPRVMNDPMSHLKIRKTRRKSDHTLPVGNKPDHTLIGALTLKALALKVDPKTGKLERTELLLL